MKPTIDESRFAQSRKAMAATLHDDEELLAMYKANIKMMLHDLFEVPLSTGDEMASRVMHLVFRHPEPYPEATDRRAVTTLESLK